MKVEVKLGVDGYKTNVHLTPELYDGHPPLESVTFQTRMRILDPNVCAVSMAIVLNEFASESIVYHDAAQVHVAQAIETFLSDRRCRITPVEQTPMAIASGNRKVIVGSDALPTDGTAVFELGDSSSFSSSASLNRIHIASNLPGFFADDEAGFVKAAISAAIFVAPDYAFSEISLSNRYAAALGESDFTRYQALLASINLKLTKEN